MSDLFISLISSNALISAGVSFGAASLVTMCRYFSSPLLNLRPFSLSRVNFQVCFSILNKWPLPELSISVAAISTATIPKSTAKF